MVMVINKKLLLRFLCFNLLNFFSLGTFQKFVPTTINFFHPFRYPFLYMSRYIKCATDVSFSVAATENCHGTPSQLKTDNKYCNQGVAITDH